MGSLNQILAREMSKSKGRASIVPKNDGGNVSPYLEWKKWLSYVPEFERKRIEYFDSKKISELSYYELEEASRHRKNQIFAELFQVYGTSECSEENYMMVYNYMSNESILELMLSKLTPEELYHAKEEIEKLSNLSKEELNAKVKREQRVEVYNRLSMVDSYILHLLSNINCARNISSVNKQFVAELERNTAIRQRTLCYSKDSFCE
mgnify:FL=1